MQKLAMELFGNRLRQCRIQKKLSQSELAFKCNMEKQSIYRLESGNTNPTLAVILRLSQALEIDPQKLFEQINWPSLID